MGLHNAATESVSIGQDLTTRRITVASPYNTDFTAGAKAIGGRWDQISRRWTFPAEHEAHVRALCTTVYGTCDGAPKPTREGLEARLAQHLAAVVEIQKQLALLDGEAEPA
jgi:hypothetical protein